MSQSLKKDTLAYQLGVRPGSQLRYIGNSMLVDVVVQLNQFFKTDSLTTFSGAESLSPEGASGRPEADALRFYMLNHAVALIRQKYHPLESLGAALPLLEEYHDNLAARSARMFFYLLLICARESRHERSSPDTSSLWKTMSMKFPDPIISFHKKIKNSGSSEAAARLRENPPNVLLGQFTEYLSYSFHNGDYSKGYGGKAWAAVADVLNDFVHGRITAEMMMDTAFTLAHNNGPIFNKGMLFEIYTPELATILDVQRSGQIPQYIASKEGKFLTIPLREMHQRCVAVLGGQFEGYVDWFLVEDLGAVLTYKQNKELQVQKYGYPASHKAKAEIALLKEKKKALDELAEKSDWVWLTPNIKIKKLKKVREDE